MSETTTQARRSLESMAEQTLDEIAITPRGCVYASIRGKVAAVHRSGQDRVIRAVDGVIRFELWDMTRNTPAIDCYVLPPALKQRARMVLNAL